jgi:hypothetical protein
MPTGSQRVGRGVRRAGGAGARGRRTAGAGAGGRKEPRRQRAAARSPRLEAIAVELCAIAERAGVRVRQERLLREVGYHTQSGLVKLGGEEILLLDHELAPDLKIDLLVGVLASRDLSGIEVSDDARHALAAVAGRERQRPPARAAAAAAAARDDEPGSSAAS